MKIHTLAINDEDYCDLKSCDKFTYEYAQDFVDNENSFCFIEPGSLEGSDAILIDLVFYSEITPQLNLVHPILIKNEYLDIDIGKCFYNTGSYTNISDNKNFTSKSNLYSGLFWINFDYLHILHDDIYVAILMNLYKLINKNT